MVDDRLDSHLRFLLGRMTHLQNENFHLALVIFNGLVSCKFTCLSIACFCNQNATYSMNKNKAKLPRPMVVDTSNLNAFFFAMVTSVRMNPEQEPRMVVGIFPILPTMI